MTFLQEYSTISSMNVKSVSIGKKTVVTLLVAAVCIGFFGCEKKDQTQLTADKGAERSFSFACSKEQTGAYVINTSSRRIHTSDCPYVSKIKQENRKYLSDLNLALSQGYTACGHCQPCHDQTNIETDNE